MIKIFVVLLGIVLAISCTSPESICVDDFGAIPNDSICDAQAIQNAFDYAVRNHIGSVIFSPGEYYFADSIYDQNDFEDPRFLSYVLVSGIENLKVVGALDELGQPTTKLIKYNPCLNTVRLPGHLQFDDCPNLSIKNLVFDNRPQYASAGKIIRISKDSVFVRILEGLPVVDGMAAYCMNVWNLETHNLKHQQSLTFGSENELIKKNAYWKVVNGDTMLMVSDFVAPRIKVGDGLSWHFGAETSFQLSINRCDNLQLENLLIPNIAGFGIQTSGCHNVSGKNVQFKSINNQLAVGARDAWKLHMCDGTIDVDNMYVEGVRWDGQNVHGTFFVLEEVIDDFKIRVWKKYPTIRPFDNDSIGFWVGDKEYKNFVKGFEILKHTNDDVKLIMELSEPVPEEVKEGNLIAIYRWDIDNYNLSNSTFRNIAGCASIIKNRKVRINNCKYENIMYPALLLGGEIKTHYEGTFPEDVIVKNSVFSGSGWVSRLHTKGLVGIGNSGYDYKVIGNVQFEDCLFENGEIGIDINHAKKVKIKNCAFTKVDQEINVDDQQTIVEIE